MIYKKNIFNYLKKLLFLVVFLSMSLQYNIRTIDLFFETNFELVEFDIEEEEDADEEDTIEKENKDHFIKCSFNNYKFNESELNLEEISFVQAPFWEFNFDIHTPPPDFYV